jgi:hypothetical protein
MRAAAARAGSRRPPAAPRGGRPQPLRQPRVLRRRGRRLLLPRVVRAPLLGVAEQLVGGHQRQEVVLVRLRARCVRVQLLGALRQAGGPGAQR